MGSILRVQFAQGDVVEQLFQLKVSALKNADKPELWRLTDELIHLLIVAAKKGELHRWPDGYVTEDRLFGVPVDHVRTMPHLLCDSYVVYPYHVSPTIELIH